MNSWSCFCKDEKSNGARKSECRKVCVGNMIILTSAHLSAKCQPKVTFALFCKRIKISLACLGSFQVLVQGRKVITSRFLIGQNLDSSIYTSLIQWLTSRFHVDF